MGIRATSCLPVPYASHNPPQCPPSPPSQTAPGQRVEGCWGASGGGVLGVLVRGGVLGEGCWRGQVPMRGCSWGETCSCCPEGG